MNPEKEAVSQQAFSTIIESIFFGTFEE